MTSAAAYSTPQAKTLRDYIEIFRHHRGAALTVSLCALLATLVAALVWPPLYRSTATILIEQQEIPPELVRSTVSTYADQRIQIINQRVMTRANLADIIRKYDLYPAQRRRDPMEEVIEHMRADIRLKTVSADVVDPRNGVPTQATIAFTLSYENGSPQLAQKVANELTSLFLNENLSTRREMASQASSFLTDEANQVGDQISKLESQLAKLKERNVDNMPDMVQYNMQLSDRTDRDLMDVEQELRSLRERRIYLQSQLAQINPRGALYSESGERILGPVERLKTLRAKYTGLAAIYAPEHPDLVRMRKEIASLEAEVGAAGSTAKELQDSLTSIRGELAADRKRYGEKHPTVQSLERQMAALEKALAKQRQLAADPQAAEDADNPAYIEIQAQLQTVDAETKSLLRKQTELKAKLEDIDKRLAESPAVEREYRELSRDYDNAWARYKELKAKQTEAKLAEALETERKGERFTLIDPPLLPEKPASPNRLMIGFLGVVLSAAGGIGTAALKGGMDATVRGVKGVISLIDMVPLAGIPYIETEEELRRRARRKWLIAGTAAAVLCCAILIEHFFFIPLDVLWFAILRHFQF